MPRLNHDLIVGGELRVEGDVKIKGRIILGQTNSGKVMTLTVRGEFLHIDMEDTTENKIISVPVEELFEEIERNRKTRFEALEI